MPTRVKPKCPSSAVLRTAAGMILCGASWGVAAKAMKRSAARMKVWPTDYPDEWAEACRAAADDVRAMVAQEGAEALKRQKDIAENAVSKRRCPRCRGAGETRRPGADAVMCENCGGEGVVQLPDQQIRCAANSNIMTLWGRMLPSQVETIEGNDNYEQSVSRVDEAERRRKGEAKRLAAALSTPGAHAGSGGNGGNGGNGGGNGNGSKGGNGNGSKKTKKRKTPSAKRFDTI